jgi:hypothetical protein
MIPHLFFRPADVRRYAPFQRPIFSVFACLGGILSSSAIASYFPELQFEGFRANFRLSYPLGVDGLPERSESETIVVPVPGEPQVIRPGFSGNVQVNTTTPTLNEVTGAVDLWSTRMWDYAWGFDDGFIVEGATYSESSDRFIKDSLTRTEYGMASYGADVLYWQPGSDLSEAIGSSMVHGGAGSVITEVIPDEITLGTTYTYYSQTSFTNRQSAALSEIRGAGFQPGVDVVDEGTLEQLIRINYLGVAGIPELAPSYFEVPTALERPSAIAIVRATEYTSKEKSTITLHYPDGTQSSTRQTGLGTSTTVLEWRVNGMGVVLAVTFHGAQLDDLIEQDFFPKQIPGDEFAKDDQWITQLDQSFISAYEIWRNDWTSGTLEVPFEELPVPQISADNKLRLLDPLGASLGFELEEPREPLDPVKAILPTAQGPYEGGYYSLEWFGWLYAENFPWTYHLELGHFFFGVAAEDGLTAYHIDLGWIYTREGLYPNFYRFADQRWYFYSGCLTTVRAHG